MTFFIVAEFKLKFGSPVNSSYNNMYTWKVANAYTLNNIHQCLCAIIVRMLQVMKSANFLTSTYNYATNCYPYLKM